VVVECHPFQDEWQCNKGLVLISNFDLISKDSDVIASHRTENRLVECRLTLRTGRTLANICTNVALPETT